MIAVVGPAWEPCSCGNFWCNIHGKHAHECDCPHRDQWPVNPYTTPAPKAKAALEKNVLTDEAASG